MPLFRLKPLLPAALLGLLAACTTAGPSAGGSAAPTSQDQPEGSIASEPNPTADQKALLEPTPTVRPRQDPRTYDEYEIVTLLPPDAIRSIDNPTFLSAAEADEEYEPDELIIGVEFDGDARAYSIPLLSSHEIVNDTVGGRKIAVTW